MSRRSIGLILFAVGLFAVWAVALWAADLGTITFTRSTGMGVSATAGQNTIIRNVNQVGTQCVPPGAACAGRGPKDTFANTSNPFEANVACNEAVDDTGGCKARFDPGLPDAFDTLPIKDTMFGQTGVPCGAGDPNLDPLTGDFPYDCNSAGTIYQIVPKGVADFPNAAGGCSSTNTSTVGTSPSNPTGTTGNLCGSTTVDPVGATLPANFRNAPPSTLIVGAPFQIYESRRVGNIRVHHIQDGISAIEGGPDSGAEDLTTAVSAGGSILRYLFDIKMRTDARGHIMDDGAGNVRANGTFMLDMDDRHLQFNCQVPATHIAAGGGTIRPDAGLGSFRAGDDLSPTGAGLLIDARTGRLDCFDDGGQPCPTGRVLDTVGTSAAADDSFCPGEPFPGP